MSGGQESAERNPVPSGPVRIVVRFDEELEVAAGQDAALHLPGSTRNGWDEIVAEFPGIRLRPLFESIDPEAIRNLVDAARHRDPAFVPPRFFAYFSVHPAAETDVNELLLRLRTWEAVEHAYVSRPAPNPSPTPDDDPGSVLQGYLDAAPVGIDARFAWTILGGDGAGQRFVDVEKGWLLTHEDLDANVSDAPIHGTASTDLEDVAHGTRVLGVVCAVDNELGGIGIAPNLAAADVAAYDASDSRPAAIAAAASLLCENEDRGVLLIEAQTWADASENMLAPVEVDDADYAVIRTAVSAGIVVVEAGGNGKHDPGAGSGPIYLEMDTYERDGMKILSADPADVGYRDSGAIIVSAGHPETLEPRSYAPRGGRIDCWAWGTGVHTCTATLFGTSNAYTDSFSATSSASAIVAGAALALLGIARAHDVEPMEAEDVREILRDPTTGTLPAIDPSTGEPYPIGVMPDLRAIFDALKPDLVIRDLGRRRRQFVSQDLIVRSSQVADPQSEFGAGSPAEDATDLSEPIVWGQRNFVYVRVSNHAGWSAPDVTVNAYWSPSATLVTPSEWRPIGSTVLAGVPSGNVLTVAEIPWEAADLPRGVPCCLVADVGTALDPSPLAATAPEWETFLHGILPSDNVAWNGRQILTIPWMGGTVTGAFLARGAPDQIIQTRLEVEAHLPWNAQAALVTPALRPFVPFTGPPLLPRRPGETVRFALLRKGVTEFDEAELTAGARIPLVLEVTMPWPVLARSYRVVARQRVGRRVVGQVTWSLVRGPRP